MKKINAKEFENLVENSEDLVLVDFYTEWCGPCKMMAPVLEQISEEVDDYAKVYKIDIDEHNDIANKYGIFSVPTLKVFNKGEIVKEMVGFQPKQNVISELERFK